MVHLPENKAAFPGRPPSYLFTKKLKNWHSYTTCTSPIMQLTCPPIACENVCFSSLFATGDVSREGNSILIMQINVLHNKSGSHGVPNINLSNFMCLMVDFGKVLSSSANALQQNSNASREDYIPQILTVLIEILCV